MAGSTQCIQRALLSGLETACGSWSPRLSLLHRSAAASSALEPTGQAVDMLCGARSTRRIGRPQTSFRRDYSGGWKSRGRAVWASFVDRCGPYTGPALPFLIVACTAPDGTSWAVQAWQRLVADARLRPLEAEPAAMEFHPHWSGPVALLEVSPNWTYGGQWQAGSSDGLTLRARPSSVRGRRRRAGSQPLRTLRLHRHAKLGLRARMRGMTRASVLHLRNGAFCYSFATPPPGYPDSTPRGPAVERPAPCTRHR